MRFRSGRSVALGAALSMTALLIPGAPAQAQVDALDIEFGQDFFESAGVPGFSLRFYPGGVNVHQGDTLHFFGFGAPVLLPEGEVPQEFLQNNAADLGDPFFDFMSDPDDGADEFKFNTALFTGNATCGAVEDPCEWDGSGNDILNVGEAPELYVTITADPGDVIYAISSNKGDASSRFRIEVVPGGDPGSTQAALDERAADLKAQDFNLASALHERFSSKATKHRTPSGKVVWDAYAGLDRGPISMLAMYPKKLEIEEGQSVQWHFPLENESHNVVFPFTRAKQISRSTFIPVCDPDGDNGPGPDVDPTFPQDPDALPECPGGPDQLEFELNPLEILSSGNGTLSSGNDLESSGIKGPEMSGGSFFNEDEWTVKFKAGGEHRFGCTIHGPGFMGGKVVVK